VLLLMQYHFAGEFFFFFFFLAAIVPDPFFLVDLPLTWGNSLQSDLTHGKLCTCMGVVHSEISRCNTIYPW
jgi:hypothetical protein